MQAVFPQLNADKVRPDRQAKKSTSAPTRKQLSRHRQFYDFVMVRLVVFIIVCTNSFAAGDNVRPLERTMP